MILGKLEKANRGKEDRERALKQAQEEVKESVDATVRRR